jgi:hypothetical protein
MSVCLSESSYPKPYTDEDGRIVMPARVFTVRVYYPEHIVQALIV